jgi:hypothetical protein
MFIEYDFTVVYKSSKNHIVVNVVSRLLDITELTSVLNSTIDASLFYIEPKWLNDVKEFLRIGQIEGTLFIQHKQRLIRKMKPFTLKNGELYKMGQDNKLQRCLTTIEAQMVMRELHDRPSRGHFATKIM